MRSTCFRSLLAHDFPHLLTTVVPNSTKQRTDLVTFKKQVKKRWKQTSSVICIYGIFCCLTKDISVFLWWTEPGKEATVKEAYYIYILV